MGQPAKPALRRLGSARERIDDTAYELFSRHGIRATGVDTLAARAGVAKMTLYKHYPSKEALALAFLRRREELWTRAWLHHEVERRARTPGAKLLAQLASLIADGHLKVPIANVYPLAHGREAYTELERRHTRGKIVLRP